MPKYPFSQEELEERIKKTNEKILGRICKKCFMGVMKPHHERPDLWRKCETCGYTIPNNDDPSSPNKR